jgi:hypothetical protein
MREISLFCEDSFHERFVGALIKRFQRDYGVAAKVRILSAAGGLPRMHFEFKSFLRDLSRGMSSPDAVIAVVDANCKEYNGRKAELDKVLGHYPQFEGVVHYAIPDPHIERWMMADERAFQVVFGRGCTLPSAKCEKNKYKKLLLSEIRDSGIDPPLGGLEYAKDIVEAMDLGRVETSEPSFGKFLSTLKGLFNGWKKLGP